MSRDYTVLLADECPLSRSATKAILGLAEIAGIVETEDATQAAIHLARRDCDLLIVDFELGGAYSIDLVRRIRSGKAGCRHDLPVIVLGGTFDEAWLDAYVENQVIHAGATACVVRPLTVRKLLPIVVNALTHRVHEVVHHHHREQAKTADHTNWVGRLFQPAG
jgi:DNA-binding NarL/FixJ family response regulator